MSLKTQLIIMLKNIKSACDILLHRSLIFQSPPGDLRELEAHSVRYSFAGPVGSCAVCLCVIGEGDEIRELRCRHAFHRQCVDRWVESGHWTCPLCRTHLKLSRFDRGGEVVFEEVVVLGFVNARAGDGDGGETWWLR